MKSKHISHYQFRKEMIKCLPKYFKETDVVDFQIEVFLRNGDKAETGVALIKEDGNHLTVSTTELYDGFVESGYKKEYIDAFCEDLGRKYQTELKESIEKLQKEINKEGLENRICCTTLNAELLKQTQPDQVFEKRGNLTLTLNQFIKDEDGNISIASVTKEMIKKCEKLNGLNEHELIEAAISNTSKKFKTSISSLYETVATEIVETMVDEDMLPPIDAICNSAREALVQKLSEGSPAGVLLNNEGPSSVISLFYPKLLSETAKVLRNNNLTIFISTTDDVIIFAGDYSNPKKLKKLTEDANDIIAPLGMSVRYALSYNAKEDTLSFQ